MSKYTKIKHGNMPNIVESHKNGFYDIQGDIRLLIYGDMGIFYYNKYKTTEYVIDELIFRDKSKFKLELALRKTAIWQAINSPEGMSSEGAK